MIRSGVAPFFGIPTSSRRPTLSQKPDPVQGRRPVEELALDFAWAEEDASRTGKPARRYKDFRWSTLDSWSRRRRVAGKAEWTRGEANPRFVVTSLRCGEIDPRVLYERVYCARGDMENRVKECQLDLFAGRASAATMRANQLRLWFASEDRRPGPRLRPAHQARHGLGASLPGRVRPGPRQVDGCRAGLTIQTPQAHSAPATPFAERWRRSMADLRRAPPSGRRSPEKPACNPMASTSASRLVRSSG